mmetsp:Transcript_22279/g.30639  ORF Transcript_22279/g.30639 Transcript_22279/m.30639 type:complete len:282 (+) Transcript_22279:607-1452(+)
MLSPKTHHFTPFLQPDTSFLPRHPEEGMSLAPADLADELFEKSATEQAAVDHSTVRTQVLADRQLNTEYSSQQAACIAMLIANHVSFRYAHMQKERAINPSEKLTRTLLMKETLQFVQEYTEDPLPVQVEESPQFYSSETTQTSFVSNPAAPAAFSYGSHPPLASEITPSTFSSQSHSSTIIPPPAYDGSLPPLEHQQPASSSFGSSFPKLEEEPATSLPPLEAYSGGQSFPPLESYSGQSLPPLERSSLPPTGEGETSEDTTRLLPTLDALPNSDMPPHH